MVVRATCFLSSCRSSICTSVHPSFVTADECLCRGCFQLFFPTPVCFQLWLWWGFGVQHLDCLAAVVPVTVAWCRCRHSCNIPETGEVTEFRRTEWSNISVSNAARKKLLGWWGLYHLSICYGSSTSRYNTAPGGGIKKNIVEDEKHNKIVKK